MVPIRRLPQGCGLGRGARTSGEKRRRRLRGLPRPTTGPPASPSPRGTPRLAEHLRKQSAGGRGGATWEGKQAVLFALGDTRGSERTVGKGRGSRRGEKNKQAVRGRLASRGGARLGGVMDGSGCRSVNEAQQMMMTSSSSSSSRLITPHIKPQKRRVWPPPSPLEGGQLWRLYWCSLNTDQYQTQ